MIISDLKLRVVTNKNDQNWFGNVTMRKYSPDTNCIVNNKPVFLNWFLRLLLILFFFGGGLELSAQATDDPVVEKISKEILSLIRKNLDSQSTRIENDNLEPADRLFNITEPNLDLKNKDQIFRYQIQHLKKDIGVNLRAQHFINHDQSFDQEDATDGNLSGSRTRVGVEWNILKEGWLGNQQKAKRLDNQRKLDNLKFSLENNDSKLYYRFNLMIYLFNESKIKLLTAREAQLIEQQKLLYQVYFLKGILYEEIIDIKSRIEQVKVQLKNYRDYNDWFESTLGENKIDTDFAIDELPVLHVNLDYLLHENSKEVLLDSIKHLEEEIAFGADRTINDISLRLQAYRNINHFADDLRDKREFNSIGVGLTVPLETLINKKTKNNLANAKMQNRQHFNNYEALNTSSEIINYYYEYNYKMKTYMEFLHKEMLYREKIRVETVNQKNYHDIYRSLRILRHLDIMRNIQAEMLDLKQQMYLLLLKIYGKTHYETIQNFVRPLDVNDFYQRLPADRLMTITSEDLASNQPEFIRDYLTTNGIRRIVLAAGLDSNNPKVLGLKKAVSGKKIQLARKFSGDELLESTNASGSLAYAISSEKFSGVVLDFSAYKSPDQLIQVQKFLISQFELFNQRSTDDEEVFHYQISLAPGYPIEFLKVLSKTVDLISFKVDQPQQLDYFELLAKNGFNDINKIGIDLEKKNFKDRIELEAYIGMVNNVYKINYITLNGLNDFLDIDTKSIIKKE